MQCSSLEILLQDYSCSLPFHIYIALTVKALISSRGLLNFGSSGGRAY